MNCGRDIEDEFIKWGDELEKPGEEWANKERSDNIPKEKINDAELAGAVFFPGDTWMHKIGEEGSEEIGNETI